MKPTIPFWNRFKFFLERQFVKGPHYQLLAVAALIGLISVIGGVAVLGTGEPLDRPGPAIWWAFLRLTDPGYLGDDVGAWRRVVSTVLTVSGYVVFLGALVAILTQWLNGRMRQLERGLTPVATRGHIVLLGWTSRTVPIVRELILSTGRVQRFLRSRGQRALQLVVLAEEMNASMAQSLRDDAVIGRRARRIVLRSGGALNPEHLQRVSCRSASAIILPSEAFRGRSLVPADVETIKTLLTLDGEVAARSLDAAPYVVAEIQDARMLPVALAAYHGPLEIIASDRTLSRLIAQTVRHPGLSQFYAEVLTQAEGNEFFLRTFEEAAGQTFGAFATRFPRAILCGLLRRDGGEFTPLLSPPPDLVLRADDSLVLLAPQYEQAQPGGWVSGRVPAPEPGAPGRAPAVRRVLVLGWNQRHPALLAALAEHASERFEVDIVSVLPASERLALIERFASVAAVAPARQVETDYLIEGELRRLQPAAYDSILIASSDLLESHEQADARTVVGYLVLRQILAESPRRPQVILELADPENQSIVGVTQDEVLVSPLILSHMLAQVALRRELRMLFDALFGAGGADVTFRPVSRYGLAGAMGFGELAAAVSAHGDIALGVYQAAGARRLQVNPPRTQTLHLKADDRVVVLSAGH